VKQEGVYYDGVKRYYTILEAALTVEVPDQKVYSLLRKGRIKGFKRGGRWIITREEVNKIKAYTGCSKGDQE